LIGLLTLTQSTPLVHVGLEWLAYLLSAQVYLRTRRKSPIEVSKVDQMLLLSCTIIAAALGALSLHIAESWSWVSQQPTQAWISGKSVLGGLLGGTLGTEFGKRLVNWRHSTGDAWVPALGIGLVVGRIGCQLSGTWDMTYGSPTGASWGWNYGDGIPRYPTALMEALAVLAMWAWLRRRSWSRSGQMFNAFLLGYCLLRFFIDFLKPPFGAAAADATVPLDLFLGLTAIQWTALAGAAWMTSRLRRPV